MKKFYKRVKQLIVPFFKKKTNLKTINFIRKQFTDYD